MHIWVDADACPNVIKDILFRAAERAHVPLGSLNSIVYLVAVWFLALPSCWQANLALVNQLFSYLLQLKALQRESLLSTFQVKSQHPKFDFAPNASRP